MFKKLKAAGIAAAMLIGTSASAATVTESYSVTSTLNKLGNPVAFGWMTSIAPGLSAVFNFKDPGSFTVFDDGTANMSGTVFNDDDMSSGFTFSLDLDSSFLVAPTFKAAFPDVVAHGNEEFFDPEGGTVSGFGVLAGLDFTISRFPTDGSAVFQYGGGLSPDRGTNQHNGNFGFSVWLGAGTITSSTCLVCDSPEIVNLQGAQFDIVGDLSANQVPTVPLPAGGMLLLTGLGLFGALRMRRT